MNYSYVMEIDNVDKLSSLGLSIKKYGEDYGIIFSNEQIPLFEDFICQNLKNGFWNEYLGENKVFIFKFGNGEVKKYILTEENQEEILKLCRTFANYEFSSIDTMLRDNEFYIETYYKEL